MADPIRDIQDKIHTTQEFIDKHKQLLENAESLLAAYNLQLEGLEGEREATKAMTQIQIHMPIVQSFGEQKTTVSKRRIIGKPKTDLIEDLILEHGKPMHMTDILAVGIERGLQFNGKRPKQIQLRSTLSNCKRLYNIGGNKWWVTGIALPPTLQNNGHAEETIFHASEEGKKVGFSTFYPSP